MAGRIAPMLLKKIPAAAPWNAAACRSSAWADLPAPKLAGRGPSVKTPNFSPPSSPYLQMATALSHGMKRDKVLSA